MKYEELSRNDKLRALMANTKYLLDVSPQLFTEYDKLLFKSKSPDRLFNKFMDGLESGFPKELVIIITDRAIQYGDEYGYDFKAYVSMCDVCGKAVDSDLYFESRVFCSSECGTIHRKIIETEIENYNKNRTKDDKKMTTLSDARKLFSNLR